MIKGLGDPFRIDSSIHGGGILFYVKEDVPAKLLSIAPIPSECFFAELILRKQKKLIFWCCNPHKKYISKHLEMLSKNLDFYSSQYKSNIIIENFSVRVTDPYRNDFCNACDLLRK